MSIETVNDKLWIGIDWGTHSSKWVYSGSSIDTTSGKIYSSDMLRINDKLLFSPDENILNDVERIRELKRKIILDPLGQDFWNADRKDTGSSLGEAVSFSFCSLFKDIIEGLNGNPLYISTNTDIEIGFSLPNWLGQKNKEHKTALEYFHQAVKVSCWIFDNAQNYLPKPNTPYFIKNWKNLIKTALDKTSMTNETIIIDNITEKYYSVGRFKWSYLVESCAAGLPYLRSATIMDSLEKDAPNGLPGLGKLLVIDVGAGSTDVGYMVISRTRQENKRVLNFFPPAATCPVAGNELTEKLREYHRQQGKDRTWQEEEEYKLTDSDWHDEEFANEWRRKICNHVKNYISKIPDHRWLGEKVQLQIVVTGGSGIVPKLNIEIKEAVKKGLEERGYSAIPINIIDETKLGDSKFEDEAQYARRAVSIGAADKDKPSLKYLSKLDPAPKTQLRLEKY